MQKSEGSNKFHRWYTGCATTLECLRLLALLKFIGGIRLRVALVKCGITLAVALLDLTIGVILTAKSGNKSMGGPFGQWAHQYDVPPRTQSGEEGMVAQSNKYPGSICGLRPIFVLFSHLFPM